MSIQLHFNFYLDPFHRGPPHRPPGEGLCQVEIRPKAIPEAGLEPAHPNAINVKPLAYWVLGLFSKEIGEAGLEPAIEYSAMGFTICLLPDVTFCPGRTHPVFLPRFTLLHDNSF